jgi:hypothetical protein
MTISEHDVNLTPRRGDRKSLVLERQRITAVGWSRWLLRHGQLWLYTTASPVGFVILLKVSAAQAEQISSKLEIPLGHPTPIAQRGAAVSPFSSDQEAIESGKKLSCDPDAASGSGLDRNETGTLTGLPNEDQNSTDGIKHDSSRSSASPRRQAPSDE